MHFENIKEIFTSIQGEGPFIGAKQLFVRFCGCNLNCDYCDTDFASDDSSLLSASDIVGIVRKEKNLHSVALTGGEPLLRTEFLQELLPKINIPVYLETNATLFDELEKIIEYVDIISADIKLESASGLKTFDAHKKFFDICKKYNKETFVKIVFDEKITEEEIVKSVELVKLYDYLIVLQPKMIKDGFSLSKEKIEEIFEKYTSIYSRVRLIPQTHKFLGVR